MPRALGLLELEFHLPGCSSLKEKRGRLGGLRDRFGRQPMLAVCETGYADSWQRSQYSFVALANDAGQVNALLDSVEREIAERIDAVIVRRVREADA